jgi:hypothetical protein
MSPPKLMINDGFSISLVRIVGTFSFVDLPCVFYVASGLTDNRRLLWRCTDQQYDAQ